MTATQPPADNELQEALWFIRNKGGAEFADRLEVALSAQAARHAAAEAERDAYARETGDLRQGVTKAIGMPWHEMPSGGAVCPDDQDIIAACATLKARIATMREALEPFALVAEAIDPSWADRNKVTITWPDDFNDQVTIGDLRRAAAAIRTTEAARVGETPT